MYVAYQRPRANLGKRTADLHQRRQNTAIAIGGLITTEGLRAQTRLAQGASTRCSSWIASAQFARVKYGARKSQGYACQGPPFAEVCKACSRPQAVRLPRTRRIAQYLRECAAQEIHPQHRPHADRWPRRRCRMLQHPRSARLRQAGACGSRRPSEPQHIPAMHGSGPQRSLMRSSRRDVDVQFQLGIVAVGEREIAGLAHRER